MSSVDDDVRKLLLDALDGAATGEQLARLNALLRDSVPLRRSAARFLSDDSILTEEIGTLEEALAFLRNSANVAPAEAGAPRDQRLAVPAGRDWREAARLSSIAPARPSRGIRRAVDYVNSHGLLVAAAAVLCLAAFAWDYLKMMQESDRLHGLAAAVDAEEVQRMRRGRRPTTASPGTAPVARVTGLSNCVWPDGDAGFKFGDPLTPGQRLKLASGVLQLTYETGAKVMVEGPVDMVMTTPIEARLSEGKIAAAVPRFARGYTIVTPTAEVVDLGTEFGVSVDDAGASEVHVFDGDVVTRSVGGGAGPSDLIHAREDEAVQFSLTERGPRRITVDHTKFVRRLTPDLPAEELPPIPVTGDLALWLAADLMPNMKEGAPVSAWPDVLIGGNRFPDDAWQFDERLCPVWLRDGAGRPAVRFDGWKTYLATSPMETGDSQTAFVVFAPNPASFASSTHGGMLLKYGLNAPSLELSLMTDHSPRGLVWAADQVGSPSNVGMIKGKAVQPLAPCAVAYRYDVAGNQAELLVDGVSQGVTTAPRKIEQHAKKYIGSHAQPWYEAYYLGNIYEVIVYDAALDDADRRRVFEYLSDRYGIKLGR